MNGRAVAIIATVLVAVGVGVGLYLAGSPGEARLLRQDDRREELLSSANFMIQRYHREQGRLPVVLDSAGPQWGDNPLRTRDPVTGIPFGYRVVSDSAWELCATFARASEGGRTGLWSHPAGKHCFTERVEPHRP